MHIKRRPKYQGNGDPYSYRLASFADVNGGAEEFAFETPFANPLYPIHGRGRNAGQFLVFGSGAPLAILNPQATPEGIPQLTDTPDPFEESSEIQVM